MPNKQCYMKKRGCNFEYEDERSRDIMRAYTELIQSCDVIYLPTFLRKLVNMPSKRFWVSAERASIVVSEIMRGKKPLLRMLPTKREMYMEIYNRIIKLKEALPELSIYELAQIVVEEPAPKFYLTPGSAKVIIYRIKKQCRQRRMPSQHPISRPRMINM